jgi:hypothetical protein
MFPAVPSFDVYRGEGFKLALLSHFSAFCGPFAVSIPSLSPDPAALWRAAVGTAVLETAGFGGFGPEDIGAGALWGMA